jgi:hypothetical protein
MREHLGNRAHDLDKRGRVSLRSPQGALIYVFERLGHLGEP